MTHTYKIDMEKVIILREWCVAGSEECDSGKVLLPKGFKKNNYGI